MFDLTKGTIDVFPPAPTPSGGEDTGSGPRCSSISDKTVGCFNPRNTLVIAPGLFSGTLVPGAGRAELVGDPGPVVSRRVVRPLELREDVSASMLKNFARWDANSCSKGRPQRRRRSQHRRR